MQLLVLYFSNPLSIFFNLTDRLLTLAGLRAAHAQWCENPGLTLRATERLALKCLKQRGCFLSLKAVYSHAFCGTPSCSLLQWLRMGWFINMAAFVDLSVFVVKFWMLPPLTSVFIGASQFKSHKPLLTHHHRAHVWWTSGPDLLNPGLVFSVICYPAFCIVGHIWTSLVGCSRLFILIFLIQLKYIVISNLSMPSRTPQTGSGSDWRPVVCLWKHSSSARPFWSNHLIEIALALH